MKMENRTPEYFKDAAKCVDFVIERAGKEITIALPLALGKPNQFINALYKKAKADPGLKLRILTALSPEIPTAGSELERRIVEPMALRILGSIKHLG